MSAAPFPGRRPPRQPLLSSIAGRGRGRPDPARGPERALAAAEKSLREGDRPGAESHYRAAVTEGRLLLQSLAASTRGPASPRRRWRSWSASRPWTPDDLEIAFALAGGTCG